LRSIILLTGEEEIVIVASDLNIELKGRIDRGVGLSIFGGDLSAIGCAAGYVSEDV
jgi:hypothetical protein